MNLSDVSECSSESDSYFQTVLKTNKNRVIDRSLLTRKQHLKLLCLPNPKPKQPRLPARKIKRCKIPHICPERIDQLSIPKSVYILDVLEKYNQRLDPDRIVRLVKLLQSEKQNEGKKCKPKKGKKKRKGKKQSVKECIRIWLKMRIELTTKLIMKHLKEQENKLTPNYRQLLIALGLMRCLKVQNKPTMRYTKKYLMDICEKLAIEVDNECKPYGIELEPVEIKPEEEEEEEEKKHVIWIMSEPPSEYESEEEEERVEEEEEEFAEEEAEEITIALEDLAMLGVEEEEEEQKISTILEEGEEEEGEEGLEEEAAGEHVGEEEGGEGAEGAEGTEGIEGAEGTDVGAEEGGEGVEGEETGLEGEEGLIAELEGEESAGEGELLPGEGVIEEELLPSEYEMGEEYPGIEGLMAEEVSLIAEEVLIPEELEPVPKGMAMELVDTHPENSVSYVSWKIYDSWLEEFANNIATYGKCLRSFRDLLGSKNMLYSDREKIETIITNWSTYLSDCFRFETQISEAFKGKPVTKCPKCADYTLYDIPIDHELPPELEEAAQSTARWTKLLSEAERLCRSFAAADDLSVISHETIEIVDTGSESAKSSDISSVYSFEFLQADDFVIPAEIIIDPNAPKGKKGGKGGKGGKAEKGKGGKGGKGKKGKK